MVVLMSGRAGTHRLPCVPCAWQVLTGVHIPIHGVYENGITKFDNVASMTPYARTAHPPLPPPPQRPPACRHLCR